MDIIASTRQKIINKKFVDIISKKPRLSKSINVSKEQFTMSDAIFIDELLQKQLPNSGHHCNNFFTIDANHLNINLNDIILHIIHSEYKNDKYSSIYELLNNLHIDAILQILSMNIVETFYGERTISHIKKCETYKNVSIMQLIQSNNNNCLIESIRVQILTNHVFIGDIFINIMSRNIDKQFAHVNFISTNFKHMDTIKNYCLHASTNDDRTVDIIKDLSNIKNLFVIQNMFKSNYVQKCINIIFIDACTNIINNNHILNHIDRKIIRLFINLINNKFTNKDFIQCFDKISISQFHFDDFKCLYCKSNPDDNVAVYMGCVNYDHCYCVSCFIEFFKNKKLLCTYCTHERTLYDIKIIQIIKNDSFVHPLQ